MSEVCSADESLLVQTSDLTPALTLAIAKLGREKSLSLKRGTDVIKAISENCGTANARRYYLPIFIQANAQNPDIRAGRTVLSSDAELVLPACIYAQEKLATVEANNNGIEWAKATPITGRALFEAIRKSKALGDIPPGDLATTKWQPTAHASAVLDRPNVKVGASQSISYDKLKEGWGEGKLSETLSSKGPSIVGEVTSERLSDRPTGESYELLVKAALASSPDKVDPILKMKVEGFQNLLRAQDVLASNEPIDFKGLPNKTNLVASTFTPTSYFIDLKDEIDARAAAKQIFAALPQTNSSGVGGLGTFTPYFDEPLGNEEVCPEVDGTKWPIDLSELKKVLEFRRLAGRRPVGGKLLILDTGFPAGKVGTSPFDQSYFIPNTDGDGQGANAADRYLWSSSRPPVYFISSAKNAAHGVGVLTLALGGISVLSEQRLIMSNALSQGGMVVDFMGYKRLPDNSLGVDTGAVLRTLSGDSWGQTDVASVNLSVRFNVNPLEAPVNFSGFFSELPQVLFIVASGNDSGSADDYMPARWGGTARKNVITVGAVSSSGQWWRKSNQSVDHVDLAAAGCGVPTLTWDGSGFTKVVVNGTSFSAPLVSFTANLLQEFASGARRKGRILSSGRYSADLRTKTRSSRILDVPVALATPFDVVRAADGMMRLGHVALSPGATLCGRALTRSAFAQIHRTPDLSKISVVRREGPPVSGEISFPPECDLINGQLTDIRFQEAAPSADGLSLKSVESLNVRSLESITFCDSCLWN